jgi:cytochrome c peroxidase
MTNRNKNLQFTYTLAIGVALLLSSSRAVATNEENHIQEIMAGVNGNSKIQFIVIKQEGSGNLWGPQPSDPQSQSRVMLVFFDAAGRETGKFKFPHNVPADQNPQLIATQDFANLPGAPIPDFIMPPLLNPISGKVCFENNPLNANASARLDCVSYGSFAAQTGTNSGGCNGDVIAGPPTSALPIMNTVSLKRTSTSTSCGSVPNSDFVITTTPTPTNDAGKTLTIPVATQVAQGENLFNGETFQGNGRTCATCHVASLNFALPPSNIQSRFSTVSTKFDPLFLGETNPSSFDAGFDFNLNTLVLDQSGVASDAPCIGTLQGIITSGATAARAKVLTQVSPTTYLVYGGMNPAFTAGSAVNDSNSCSATVSSITAGSLGAGSTVLGLEDPKRMRTSADTANFPQGRGLILENIDGFPIPPVFRKSPHLLNLKQRFGGFGLSSSVPDLQSFATAAVKQHFPRTLARNSGGSDPDFRLPTSDELAAMEVFMRAQEFPAGTDPNKFNLNRFVVTAAQQRGFNAFFGAAKCSFCHSGPVLSDSALFNTGVANQSINSAGMDNLPCEPSNACGQRVFSTRQLFNIANLGPFFHDGSAATLQDVVAFYNSSTFNSSPGAAFSGPINITAIGPTAADDIVAFLEGISFSPFAPTFGPVGTNVTITGANFTGATAVSFNGVAATFTESPPGTITTTVPAGATTGPITVTTPGSGPLRTTTRFTVMSVFSLSATPSSQTVSAGVNTSYTITISRTAGFTDNLTFSVAGLPAAATASFTPNPTAANFSTMTVTTTTRAQLAPWPTLRPPPANFNVRAWPLWAICVLVMVLLDARHRSKRRIPRWVFACGTFAVLLCIGCGGGGSAPRGSSAQPPQPQPSGTPSGTFTITVTATSSNSSVQPVSMPVTLIVR